MKARSRLRMEKSTRTRQAIIDACHYNILTLGQIADKLGVPKQGMNIHMLNLVEDGYLSKHDKVAKVGNQWACGYTSITDKPYVWKYRNPTKQIDEPVEQPIALPANMDIGLMIKLGYTNIIPRAGKVHQGFMSHHGKKWAINE